MYQKFSLPKNSQNFQNFAFFGKIDRSLDENVLKLSKTLNFASFSSNTSRTLLLLMCFGDVQKFGFFGKRDVFSSKEHLKVFKNTKQGYFPLECFSKVIIVYAISNRSKLEFFWKKMTFYAKKSVKDFRSTIWHFLSRLRVRLSYCFGFLKKIKILICLEK